MTTNSPNIQSLLLITEESKGTAKFIFPKSVGSAQKEYMFTSSFRSIPKGTVFLAEITIVNGELPKLVTILRQFTPGETVYLTLTFLDTKAVIPLWKIVGEYQTNVDEKEFKKLAGSNKNMVLAYDTIEEISKIYCVLRENFKDTQVLITLDDGVFLAQDVKAVIASLQKVKNTVTNPFSIPKDNWIGNYYVTPDFLDFFETIAPQVIENGDFYLVKLVGESGNGKTASAKALAAHLNAVCGGDVDFLKVTVPNLVDNTQWFGVPKAQNGNTFFELSDFSRVIMKGRAVILLDEINRVARGVANSLLGLFDGTGTVAIEDCVIQRGDITFGKGHGVIVIMTMNQGNQYAIEDIDAAFSNRRLATLEVHALDDKTLKSALQKLYNVKKSNAPNRNERISIEDIATLISVINDFKKDNNEYIDLSMRTYINILNNMNYGIPLLKAVQMVIINDISDINVRKGFSDRLLKYTMGD